MSQTLPNERIDKVAKAIASALRDVTTKDQDRRDARTAYEGASENATSARETILVTLAGVANNDHWSNFELEQGVEHALAGRNDKDTTIKTFTAEIRRACHPQARKHVAGFAKLAATVWDNETNQSKELPKPLRTAFSRRYHLFQRMISEAIDNANVLANGNDVVKWAISLDPKNNPTRMFKRFKAIRDELRQIADVFPIADVQDALEYLREVSADDFKDPSSAPKHAPEREAAAADGPEQVPAGENTPEAENASGASQSISDRLDDALRDLGA